MAAWSGVNSYTGQGSVGQYKDIKDALFYIEGNEAPIQKIAKYTKAKGPTTHYWEELAYTSNTANAEQKTEGQDLTADTPPTKTERYNYVEENAETYYVSNKVDAASKAGAFAGIKDYIRESKKQAMIELKGKLEASLLLGEGDVGSNDTTPTPGKMNGLMTVALGYGSTGYIASASFATTDGEAAFRALLNTTRSKGGMRGMRKAVFTSYTAKDSIAKNWVGNVTEVNADASAATIYADVRVYSSQYGRIVLYGHDCLGVAAGADMVVFDEEQMNIAWLYQTRTDQLGKTGLADKFAVANACTLQYDKPSTLGYLIVS